MTDEHPLPPKEAEQRAKDVAHRLLTTPKKAPPAKRSTPAKAASSPKPPQQPQER